MQKCRLKKTQQRKNKRKIWGFDIETYSRKNYFLCASVYSNENEKYFFRDVNKLKEFLTTRKMRNNIIVATNLAFDFFGTFELKELQSTKTLFQGSKLMYAKIPVLKERNGKYKYATFLDTLNYVPFGVKKMGELLKIPKLDIKDIMGKKNLTEQEWFRMEKYNMRDAEISKRYLEFLYNAFESFGATPKITSPSTSMSIFTNKYLEDTYYPHPEEISLEVVKAYYGGRCENIGRGLIEEYNVYDVNSLYPFVMRENVFPDPNSRRESYKDTLDYIQNYEGVSKISVDCPILPLPLLPFRQKNGKLIFPTGTFTGWYPHPEIRKALSMGYTIKKVHKTHYYKKTCRPFKGFVDDLYGKRLKYKAARDPMESVAKLFLNSLYGKFCQRFKDRENYIPNGTLTYAQTQRGGLIEPVGEHFLRIKEDTRMASFHLPIWGVYITSYARLHMHDLMIKHNSKYTDTDCIFTKQTIPETFELGGLKLENKIFKAVLIRPKVYSIIDERGEFFNKAKGLPYTARQGDMVTKIMKGEEFVYDQFVTFGMAGRRGLKIGEIIRSTKKLDCEDTKRDWCGLKFNPAKFQQSIPLHVINGLTREEIQTPVLDIKEETKHLNMCIKNTIL